MQGSGRPTLFKAGQDVFFNGAKGAGPKTMCAAASQFVALTQRRSGTAKSAEACVNKKQGTRMSEPLDVWERDLVHLLLNTNQKLLKDSAEFRNLRDLFLQRRHRCS